MTPGARHHLTGRWCPAILISAPIFLSLVKRLGIDPVFFGVIMVVNLSMGLASLPSGATLFFSMIGILLLITFV
ncbi:MAG TPA: TRAP transporter large permease subunit, partial [Candidatus Methylomirabilis sp.]|nr:TRAP transporter large permease subunit [Candidatus Methylomirabilis sp.]